MIQWWREDRTGLLWSLVFIVGLVLTFIPTGYSAIVFIIGFVPFGAALVIAGFLPSRVPSGE